MNVRFTASAERDLAHAFEWYERQREDLGYRFMARVDETLELIADNPMLFAPAVGEARRALVEQFPYAVWYRVGAGGVLVIGCLHPKRGSALATSRVDTAKQ